MPRMAAGPLSLQAAHMSTSGLRIGWIGVGAMGAPMCTNLLKAGGRVVVFDRAPARAEALRAAGAEVAATLGALAGAAELVFSTIFDDDGLRDVVLGADGLARCGRPGAVYVDMSTVSPAASAAVAPALAERGIAYLRAPISGAVPLAASAQLSTFVSGPREVFDRVRPWLAHITARQTWVGGGDEARAIKLAINLLLYMNTATLGEALAFGERAGVDRATLLAAINDSVIGSVHYRTKASQLQRRDYTAVGPITLALKDLALATQVAASNGVEIPLAAFARDTFARLDRHGLGGLDVAALADHRELLAADPNTAARTPAAAGTASQPQGDMT